ncbi:hypothetical protein AVEN_134-1 [Araneus ventricosus]|uniref:Uncharacterized protein n=1 Tax=Araneus ventricosus TaxID=182803 RepID=A0A4Y2D243_ARAVE|nr:hypothetical protein AVEN_134-1 [Araneus ventricosus]
MPPSTGPVFWNLVADKVLRQDWSQGVHLKAFADDFVFLVNAVTKQEVKNLANKTWTDKHKLEISLEKTNYFHIKRIDQDQYGTYKLKEDKRT